MSDPNKYVIEKGKMDNWLERLENLQDVVFDGVQLCAKGSSLEEHGYVQLLREVIISSKVKATEIIKEIREELNLDS